MALCVLIPQLWEYFYFYNGKESQVYFDLHVSNLNYLKKILSLKITDVEKFRPNCLRLIILCL